MRLLLVFLLLNSFQSEAQFESALIEQFQATFQDYGAESQIKGMSIAIRTADEVWTDQFGFSGESEPLTEDHLFAMGSVSKTITAATILRMMEDGLLSLEDPISDYLIPFLNVDPAVTIRQLLNHTSGIYNYTNNPTLWDNLLLNPEQILLLEDVIMNYVLSADFTAGTGFSYSNTNYALLGMIIEEIAGQTFYEEARERFDFDLNYSSIALPPFEMSADDLAHLWADLDGLGAIDVQASGISLNYLFSGASSAGGYVATPKDLSKWVRDLYSGQLLQPITMAELLMPSAFNGNYGLGVELFSETTMVEGIGICSTNLIGHSGDIFNTTFAYYDEEKDLSITLQTNDAVTETNIRQLAMDLFCLNQSFMVSIDEQKNQGLLSVYPNPFTDQITFSYELRSSRQVSVVLLDNTGREILNIDQLEKLPGIHKEVMNINLPAGMYCLRLLLDDQIVYKKIIKN